MPSPDALTRRLPRPDDDTTPETGPDRGECECGDWRDQHVLGRGPCKVCRYGTPPPDGADGCQRYREAFVYPDWWKPSTVPDHLPDNDESRGHGSVR